MSGSTISSYVAHPVTVSPEGYLSPLLITQTGTISAVNARQALSIYNSPGIVTVTNDGLIQATSSGGESSGSGIAINSNYHDVGVKIANNGVIRGGAGYPSVFYVYGFNQEYTYSSQGYGGAGIDGHYAASGSSITDTGKIYGGTGHVFSGQAGFGGTGVDLAASGVRLTVTRTGTIAGGYGGAGYHSGLYRSPRSIGTGVLMFNDKLDNSGLIIGGAGGGAPMGSSGYEAGIFNGLNGGVGVQQYGGKVLNRGTIAGGAGGSLGVTNGGQGGVGLYGRTTYFGSKMNADILNLGIIEGGAGGDGSGEGGQGGPGVHLLDSTLTNHGHIIGGAAGTSGVAGSDYAGAGVIAFSATLLNFGEISSGAGNGFGLSAIGGNVLNAGTIYGSDSGEGLILELGANLRNTGQIAGGAGGVGAYLYGNATLFNSGTISCATDAVVLNALNTKYGNQPGTLVVEKGAVFNGDVVANPDIPDVLELSGTFRTALTGIGTQFTGFEKIEFASGAHWTISGDTAGLASGQAITGFLPGDAISLTDAGASSGVVSVATKGVVSIDAGGVISKLDIAGATVGETGFKFSNYTLTESAQPAMSFPFPPAKPTALHPLSILDVLQHFGPAAPAPASFSHASSTETPMFGASLDPFFAPHIDAVPIVTLHA